MSIYSVISLKALSISLAFTIAAASLAGCSSSSTSLPPESVSNTVWGYPNNPQWAIVFLPDGRCLKVDDKNKILDWGKWNIEGDEIKVTSGYYTGFELINKKTGARRREYNDTSGTYRFRGNSLSRVLYDWSDWFSPESVYTKVDKTAEKYVADHIHDGKFSLSPSP